MIEKIMSTPAPLGPHKKTLEDPQLTIETACGECLICYCPRNRCGAIFDIEAQRWDMTCPISLLDFVWSVEDQDLIIGDKAGHEVWMQRLREVALAESAGTAANDSTI